MRDLAKQFGTHLDQVAGTLMGAATDLESDAGQRPAAALPSWPAEVMSLASQTAKATEEISAKVGEMQQSTTNSVAAVEAIAQTIGEINGITASIATSIEQQGLATREIARNVQEASAGTSQVSSNVTGISEAAADTGRVASRVNSASERVHGEVETLRREVTQFLQRLTSAA